MLVRSPPLPRRRTQRSDVIIQQGFVMLGKTVPEQVSDGRTFVCSAGYQPDLGLVRIYPLSMHGAPRDWDICDVRLQRNNKDSRWESWQLAGDRGIGHHDTINMQAFTITGCVPKGERHSVIPDKYYVDSIAEANERRLSLALLRPTAPEVIWTSPNGTQVDCDQLALMSAAEAGSKAKWDQIPRLHFKGSNGKSDHTLQIRDWGMFELMRKYDIAYAAKDTAKALHLRHDSSLLIGNINAHRNAWIVIKVLNIQSAQMCLPMDVAS